MLFCFCVKQKTAYEMRISDWSSDVCSSDLVDRRADVAVGQHQHVGIAELLQPAQRVFGFVLEVVAEHAHALGQGEAAEHRMLDAALRAPAAPDVEHVRRAEQVLGRDRKSTRLNSSH